MRAVVTGGAGFIGSHLADALLRAGWRVTVVDDLSGGRNLVPGAAVVRSRVQDMPALGLLRPDAVFHLAGKVGPAGVLRHAGAIAKDTVDSSLTAAGWALLARCPMIDVSTSEVYGSPDAANREDSPMVFLPGGSARREYAAAKLAAEYALLSTPGLDVRIVRPFNVAGPRQMPGGGFVLPRFAVQALRGEPLTVYTPGTQRRAFTHVADIVSGILAVLERGQARGVYNLGNPANECSIADLAADVLEATGSRAGAVVVDPREIHGPLFAEAPDKIPDAGRAQRELGWEPRIGRAEIVRGVVDFWRGRREVRA